MNFKNLEDCIKWVRANTPFAITPLRKAKTMFIYPFKSVNAFDVVTRRIAIELYKELSNGNLPNKK